ncbi:MAG: hypothetical protein HON53_01215 [Planctomycetaceae bacterium]|jgi:hypothetical protein|nr:hypothetical protein [Planctomycetaceae bacterium]MBT6154803.1 hypothetical protein [Planctomycetaceae bacterium]MBT6486670.1 hypothetical protein [Planctomycetaceae bacterium]MBT6493345.1 hypothetical protein [Planctomycetaceae bacterium]
MLNFLATLDRRWVFLVMFLAVSTAILAEVRFPEKVSPMVRDVYEEIEELPEGSNVLLAYDYDPASEGELQPMASAFTRHCAKRKHKLYFMTLWPLGVPMIQRSIGILDEEFPEYEYGEDYVNLGFRTGQEGVIKLVTTDMKLIYANDVAGTNLDKIPMTQDLKNIQKMDLIVNVSAGTPGTKEWVQYAATPYDIKMVAGTTGVGAPPLYPYIPRQLTGLLGAIKAAAEYEEAMAEGYPDLANNPKTQEAKRRMGPQLIAHVLMLLLIVVGNVIYFGQRGPKVSQ